jgi:hypothetical protein
MLVSFEFVVHRLIVTGEWSQDSQVPDGAAGNQAHIKISKSNGE